MSDRSLTPHELVELRAWTAGIGRESRELVERVIDEAESARFALNEIATHLEGLEHIRKLTRLEQAILGQARDGLAATPTSPDKAADGVELADG